MNITNRIIKGKNRPGKVRPTTLKIVIHWTANTNKGANASANVNYIENTTTDASCHYFIDDKNILLAIPCEEVAWHVGSKNYAPLGKELVAKGYQPNNCTVGIEMCVNSDGNFEKVKEYTKKLTLMLLYKYKLTPNDICRHYDITGKDCPRMFVNDEAAWTKFVNDIADMYVGVSTGKVYPKGKVTANTLNVRKGPGSNYDVIDKLPNGATVDIVSESGGWIYNGTGYMSSEYIKK